jgi:hypothetical protein
MSQAADQMRRNPEHHRSLPFAGVTHLGLCQRSVMLGWFGPRCQYVANNSKRSPVAISLPHFEYNQAAGNVVSAMAVDDDQPTKAVLHEVIKQAGQRIRAFGARPRGFPQNPSDDANCPARTVARTAHGHPNAPPRGA